MKSYTITLDDNEAFRLELLAIEAGVAPEILIEDTIASMLPCAEEDDEYRAATIKDAKDRAGEKEEIRAGELDRFTPY